MGEIDRSPAGPRHVEEFWRRRWGGRGGRRLGRDGEPALAADGDALILGVTNEATTPRGEDRRVIPNEMVSVTLPPNVPSKTRTSSMTRRLSRVALVGAAVTSLVLTGMGIAQAAELITNRAVRLMVAPSPSRTATANVRRSSPTPRASGSARPGDLTRPTSSWGRSTTSARPSTSS
jgi:hypothetical protein